MLTLRTAADLLAHAGSRDGLTALATFLGFTDSPATLGPVERATLGLPAPLEHAAMIRGRGALRALLIVPRADASFRDILTVVAAALRRHTEHVLWIVLAAGRDEVAIACWTSDSTLRLQALVANRHRIVASDAETVCALAAAAEGDDLLVHTRWCDLLGREALSRRFYRTLEHRVRGMARSLAPMPEDDAAELALLTASRLLFLSFLEAKGWLDGQRNFLSAHYDACMLARGGFHGRVLLPLFFGTLNTAHRRRAPAARRFGAIPYLNGGLFGRTALERRHPHARISDAAFGELFAQLLGAYRFTAREDQADWSEVAIDPEMLGKAFESLMAARDRRVTGAFYTPQALVAHLADEALAVALTSDDLPLASVRALLSGRVPEAPDAAALRRRLARLTVLDPACGSGAFLVHLLERMAGLHRLLGDPRDLATLRREVLARAIHGVDANPTAAWLCELRLWLSVVIESAETDMRRVVPLPNLDRNIRVGDALAGEPFDEDSALVGPSPALVRMRERYVRAAGAAKAPLRTALARDERRRAVRCLERDLERVAAARRDLLTLRRDPDLFGSRVTPDAAERDHARRLRARAAALRRDLRRLREGGALPFAFASHFAHVVPAGGFDLVIGNPPWVRLHNIPAPMRARLRDRFAVFRESGWQPHAGARARHEFGAQVDLAALFTERSLALATSDGTIALVLPAKLWSSLSGGTVRRLLATRATLRRVEDWTGGPQSFDAAVYPSLLIASRARPADTLADVAVHRESTRVTFDARPTALRYDTDPASAWLLLPAPVRAAFDLLARRGRPLGESAVGRSTLGLKCGCNDAFTVEVLDGDGPHAAVRHLGREGRVERRLLRPLLRGDELRAWTAPPGRQSVIWTHAAHGGALAELPAGAKRWLAPWRAQLTARADLRGPGAWWSLFRTDGADASRPRVVWGDFGRAPRAALLPVGDPTVPLNSCYVLSCDALADALTLTALLNSPLAAAWLNVLAEPARGGWHRYLAWTVALLPLPADWSRARHELVPIAERAVIGSPPTSAELLAAACRAWAVRVDDVAPLLAWSG